MSKAIGNSDELQSGGCALLSTTMWAIFGALALVSVAGADTVRGELSFNSQGVGKIRECKSGRIITLGEMGLDRYLRLDQQYWLASNRGQAPVVVEMTGFMSGEDQPGSELILQSPYVSRMISGRCSEDVPVYRTRY